MGCCLIAIIGFLWPRIALIAIYIFKVDIPKSVFQTQIYPILGFIFLPTATLGYELAKYYGNLQGWWLALPALGLLHDLGHLTASSRWRKRSHRNL